MSSSSPSESMGPPTTPRRPSPEADRSPLLAGTWVVDLDGVVWLSGEPIPGSGDAVARLRAAGVRVLFVSNNSSPTIADLIARLGRAGIEAERDDVVTSAQAAASVLAPGSSARVVGDPGILEALDERGVHVLSDDLEDSGSRDRPDVVVVGWTRHFDFDVLASASAAVRAGARLIGTNDDATLPTPSGPLPGAGSILAAVAKASGVEPEVAGKPHEPIARLVERRAGPVEVVVGDRPSTDGSLAKHLGARFALVLSGVTGRDDETSRRAADLVADDFAGVVAAVGG